MPGKPDQLDDIACRRSERPVAVAERHAKSPAGEGGGDAGQAVPSTSPTVMGNRGGRERRSWRAVWKPPSPVPESTKATVPPRFPDATSARPSPLKSANDTPWGEGFLGREGAREVERTVGGAPRDGDVVESVDRVHRVEEPIPVEVRDRHRVRDAGREALDRGIEGAVAVARQQGVRALLVVRGHDVGQAVAIHVGDRDPARRRTASRTRRGGGTTRLRVRGELRPWCRRHRAWRRCSPSPRPGTRLRSGRRW